MVTNASLPKILELVHGDALAVLSTLPDESFDLIAADLPYATTECAWDQRIDMDALWREFRRITTPTGTIVLNAAGRFTADLITAAPDIYKQTLVWMKSRPSGHLKNKNMPGVEHEDVVVFSKGAIVDAARSKRRMTYNPIGAVPDKIRTKRRVKTRAYGKTTSARVGELYMSWKNFPRSILQFDNPHKPYHPTQKPESLMEFLIAAYSNEGDLVLDCCMGSGTSGVAAVRLGRSYFGIERDAEYFTHAHDRIMRERDDPQPFAWEVLREGTAEPVAEEA
jgi:DNA modification methylase